MRRERGPLGWPRPSARWGAAEAEGVFRRGGDTVWVVEPSNRAVQVYRGVDAVQTLEEGDVLTGDGPLDGFSVAVAELFDG